MRLAALAVVRCRPAPTPPTSLPHAPSTQAGHDEEDSDEEGGYPAGQILGARSSSRGQHIESQHRLPHALTPPGRCACAAWACRPSPSPPLPFPSPPPRFLPPPSFPSAGYDEYGVPVMADEYDSEEDSDYESEGGCGQRFGQQCSKPALLR